MKTYQYVQSDLHFQWVDKSESIFLHKMVHIFLSKERQLDISSIYRIQSNYRTYPYKRTLMKFRSLITASGHFIYFFIKAYVVGSHLNCIDLSMQFK